jgi:hypothetical protein
MLVSRYGNEASQHQFQGGNAHFERQDLYSKTLKILIRNSENSEDMLVRENMNLVFLL